MPDLPPNACTWHTADEKAEWDNGPWTTEPDKISWTDPATGRPCLIVRNRLGALCGYVAVDPDHPYYGKSYDDVPADVHGGLTYANPCQETDDESHGICHVPEPGAPDNVWWFGFDCAHYCDLCPKVESLERQYEGRIGEPRAAFLSGPREVYRDVPYVVGQCQSLARQLTNAA